MSWLEISFVQPSAGIESTESLLEEHAVLAISIEDAKNQPLFEPKPGETPLWDYVLVKALFDVMVDKHDIISQLEKIPEIDDIRSYKIEDQDWVRNWMDRYEPIHFGNNLWICPSWLSPPDPDAINLILDPGLAFGSGTHPTTALCLEWLGNNQPDNLQVLDYGCGSGILSVASLKMGAKSVTGVDIDPQALIASRQNAEQNQINPEDFNLLLLHEDKTEDNNITFDLVLANILSGTLVGLANVLINHLKPGGHIVLSGILETQAESVIHAYGNAIEFNSPIILQDWVLLHGIKRHN